MNILQSPDRRMKAIKENTIRSFNAAANYPVDYVEFDVQVSSISSPAIVFYYFFSDGLSCTTATYFELFFFFFFKRKNFNFIRRERVSALSCRRM